MEKLAEVIQTEWQLIFLLVCVCLETDEGKKRASLKTLRLAIKHLWHFPPSSHYGSKLQQGGSPFSVSQIDFLPPPQSQPSQLVTS